VPEAWVKRSFSHASAALEISSGRNLLVRVKRVDDDVQQLLDLSLKMMFSVLIALPDGQSIGRRTACARQIERRRGEKELVPALVIAGRRQCIESNNLPSGMPRLTINVDAGCPSRSRTERLDGRMSQASAATPESQSSSAILAAVVNPGSSGARHLVTKLGYGAPVRQPTAAGKAQCRPLQDRVLRRQRSLKSVTVMASREIRAHTPALLC